MSIYQHFRENEWTFVDQALEWQQDAKLRYRERLTDFLDPRQQEILQSVIGQDDEVNLSFLGGSPFSERKRAFVAPSYIQTIEEDFKLSLCIIRYPSKFVSLEHRDVLGALMNVGLKREKFGDIVIGDGYVQVIIAEEIEDFIIANVKMIGNASVSLERRPISEHEKNEEVWDEQTTTISSLRLDAVLAQIYKLSRSKVLPIIEKGLVKVNFKTIDQQSFLLEAGDQLSVRGFGRSKLIKVEGRTKKDKYRLRFGRLS
ncbi:RNA-binding protein [Halalkalibacter sp. APA_J-10(15)]|uniref:YlmH family RNA-binding protein n=1 Tax=Halalkalibacter sp. APA_J-10(15) TaxID=2933805 RepID=UPI001FF2D58A|nr:RNA-binding protein [Halalkalibacter sp. APA_J-10(15)]MCK0470680.1 RNA-binding protein [Halalkalibacter sp. APA_J-10(15)]